MQTGSVRPIELLATTWRVLAIVAVMLSAACGSNAGPEQFSFSGSPLRDKAIENAVDQMGSEVAVDRTTVEGMSFDTPVGTFDSISFAGIDELGRTMQCKVSGGDDWDSVSSCSAGLDAVQPEGPLLEMNLALQDDGWTLFEFGVAPEVARIVFRVADGTEYEINPSSGLGVVAWPRKRGCPDLVRALDADDTSVAELTEFAEGRGSLMGSGDDRLCVSTQ